MQKYYVVRTPSESYMRLLGQKSAKRRRSEAEYCTDLQCKIGQLCASGRHRLSDFRPSHIILDSDGGLKSWQFCLGQIVQLSCYYLKTLKPKTKHSQVLITNKNYALSTPKRQRCLSNVWKLKGCLVVKTKKKEKLPVLWRKNCQYCDDNFFGQKINTAQIRFCNDN